MHVHLTIVCRSMSKIPLIMQDAASFLKVYLDKLKKYTHFENLLTPNQRERKRERDQYVPNLYLIMFIFYKLGKWRPPSRPPVATCL